MNLQLRAICYRPGSGVRVWKIPLTSSGLAAAVFKDHLPARAQERREIYRLNFACDM